MAAHCVTCITGLEMYAVVLMQVEWLLALYCGTHGSSQDHQLLTVLVHTSTCAVKALALLIATVFV